VAEQQPTGTVETTDITDALAHRATQHFEHNPGRPISWVGTSVVIVGFVIGGIAFVPSPHWVIVYIGAAVAVVGLLILLFSKAMSTDWY